MNITLPSLPIFAGLNEAALKLLSKEACRMVVSAETFVVEEGELGNKLYIVGSGAVRVIKRCKQEKDVEIAVLGPGEIFGEGCILTTLPRVASVQAIKETVLFSLSSMAFYHLYQQLPDQYGILILNISRDLARRLRHLDEVFAACH